MFGAGETFAIELHISSYLMCTYFIADMERGRFRAGLWGGGISPGPQDIFAAPYFGLGFKATSRGGLHVREHSRETIGTPYRELLIPISTSFFPCLCFLMSSVNGSSNPLSVVVGVATRSAGLRCCGATARQSLVCHVVSPRAAKPGIAPSGWRGLLAVRTGAIRQGSTLHRCKGRGAPGPAWALPYPGTY
jgi:hypothetical protein